MTTPRALKRSVLAAAVALACWVGWVGARIEVLNAAAASGDRPGWRRAGGACAVVGAAALGSALYRDYLGSLGW